jgi:hypothetical protein
MVKVSPAFKVHIDLEGKNPDKRLSEALDLLLSDAEDAQKFRKWLINKAARPGRGETGSPATRVKDWEAEVFAVALQFAYFQPLRTWEAASSEKRGAHRDRVARLARELAEALEEDIRPFYPSALELFDEDQALNILRAMAPALAEALSRGERYGKQSDYSTAGGYAAGIAHPGEARCWRSREAAAASGFEVPIPHSGDAYQIFPLKCEGLQGFPSLLRRLADYAEEKKHEGRRDARPNTGCPNHRAFARHMLNCLAQYYAEEAEPSLTVIAALVNLKFPGAGATEAKVREWVGLK